MPRKKRNAGKNKEPTQAQIVILNAMDSKEWYDYRNLSEETHLSRGTAVRVLRSMAKKGLVIARTTGRKMKPLVEYRKY